MLMAQGGCWTNPQHVSSRSIPGIHRGDPPVSNSMLIGIERYRESELKHFARYSPKLHAADDQTEWRTAY